MLQISSLYSESIDVKNCKGYSSLLLIVLLGGVAAVAVFVFQKRFMTSNEEQAIELMEEMKDQVSKAIASPVSLSASFRRNANRFACLSDGGNACANKGGQFILYSVAKGPGADPISQIPADRGVSLDRVACDNFPAKECPVRVETTWKATGVHSGCSNSREVLFVSRVILNNGTLFLDWKDEKELQVPVRLNARALCRCKNKRYANGECINPNQVNQLARFPREKEPVEDEAVDPREQPRALASEPNCGEEVGFRGELYAISDVNESGIGYIELESENANCETVDTYRFRCVRATKGKEKVASWVYLGVSRGGCTAVTRSETGEVIPVREPATEEELFEEETPAGEYLQE